MFKTPFGGHFAAHKASMRSWPGGIGGGAC